MSRPNDLRTIRILLSVMALEYFGPALRDSGTSHAFNPTWVGHARLHVVWFIVLLVGLGLVNLYLVWNRESGVRDLSLAMALQTCVFTGFWSAVALSPVYGGIIAVNGIHTSFFGVDENVFFFSIMSVVWCVTFALLMRARRGAEAPAGVLEVAR